MQAKFYWMAKTCSNLPEDEMIKVRGNRISMIFQQPQTALNPVFKVGDQLAEVLNVHQDLGKEAGWKRAVALAQNGGRSRSRTTRGSLSA